MVIMVSSCKAKWLPMQLRRPAQLHRQPLRFAGTDHYDHPVSPLFSISPSAWLQSRSRPTDHVATKARNEDDASCAASAPGSVPSCRDHPLNLIERRSKLSNLIDSFTQTGIVWLRSGLLYVCRTCAFEFAVLSNVRSL